MVEQIIVPTNWRLAGIINDAGHSIIATAVYLGSTLSGLVAAITCFVALSASIWATFLRLRLRRRTAAQAAWIDRSAIIAYERSRVLEMIGYHRDLRELLSEISKSAGNLLPGTNCVYHPHDSERGVECGKDQGRVRLHEIELRDDAGRGFGRIEISGPVDYVSAEDSEEVYSMTSELAALCMRNSLLYEGLIHHSTHDPLTDLPNRRLYEGRLAEALAQAKSKRGRLALIYIDVNRFKQVNDRYGHKTGDLYLKQISHRLKQQLRPADLLARVGGDEFIVILPCPEAFDRVCPVVARLKSCFDDSFSLDGRIVNGSASFGCARYPQDGLTAEELTRKADQAMYICKYDAYVAQEARSAAVLTPDELGLALINGDFRLVYQPQFSGAGKLTGLEVLLRLENPQFGLLPPSAFISIAERHSIIVDIGSWTLRVALQDAARWNLNRGEPISLAVNVSARQLQEPEFATSVLRCLREHEFPPERLELELVERSLVSGGDGALQQLELLRRAGVRIALDDFGTEQSCLSLLHKLPIDTIKLDHSFIQAMDTEPRVLPIVRAIVAMARSLGKRVVAEAIEHVGPVPALLDMGRMDFQGYLLSRPLPADEIETAISAWRAGIIMPEAFHDRSAGRKTGVPARVTVIPRHMPSLHAGPWAAELGSTAS